MDSTVIEQETVDELARFAGRSDEIAAIHGCDHARRTRFQILPPPPRCDDFGAHNRRHRERCVTHQFMPGAAAFVAGMKQAGVVTALVSGGFTVFSNPSRQNSVLIAPSATCSNIEKRLPHRAVSPNRSRRSIKAYYSSRSHSPNELEPVTR